MIIYRARPLMLEKYKKGFFPTVAFKITKNRQGSYYS